MMKLTPGNPTHDLPPITAVVIVCNEGPLLEGCLQRLHWVDELICIDMSSADDSRVIAARYADRLFCVDRFPVAEPTRVAVMPHCRNDWVLMVDPDEYIPGEVVERLSDQMRERPQAGAFSLPWRFHFKGKPLAGTVWGGSIKHKRMLTHRQRCTMLPYCNKINELKPGFDEVKIAGDADHCIAHYWCKGYRDLMHRHFVRYPRLDARRMHDEGQCFDLKRAITLPTREFMRCFRDFDGCRIGVHGWALSAIYGLYHALQQWMLLLPSVKQTNSAAADTRLPELRELPIHPHTATRKAA